MSTSKSRTEYTKLYENMRGVDFTAGSDGSEKRFSYLENMYVDYEGASACVESIPGYRKLYKFGARINGIFSYTANAQEYIIVHAGTSLYGFPVSARDSLVTLSTLKTGLANTKSTSFTFKDCLYILDGKNIYCMKPSLKIVALGESAFAPYIPTTYVDGVKHEPRNLLTNVVKQVFTIKSADEHSYGTEGLTYAIIDYDSACCSVSGARTAISGALYIPAYAEIGGRKYRVTEISDCAFMDNTAITALYTNFNLSHIGYKAFYGCTSLTSAVLSRSVKTIGAYSFANCSALSNFHIGDYFKNFGAHSFDLCTSLKSISYAKTAEEFANIQNTSVFEDRDINYNVPYTTMKIQLPLIGNVEKMNSASINATVTGWRASFSSGKVIVESANRELLEGLKITVKCTLTEDPDEPLLNSINKKCALKAAVCGCKVAGIFDGRAFLTGNPILPGLIFYTSSHSSNSPDTTYFSTESYLLDGEGGYPITSLCSTNKYLIAMKSRDGGEGSVFYHSREASYPTAYVHKGEGCLGESEIFSDKVFFTSSGGIFSLDENRENSEGQKLESACINPMISDADMSDATFAVWQGYLAVLCNGKIFLADSRSSYTKDGQRLHEWYFLNKIGSYLNDLSLYKYASFPRGEYKVSVKKGEAVTSTVMSTVDENGKVIYYVTEGASSYAVYPTGERYGGTFYPAKRMCALGELLFFGCDDGTVCVFNNDKRGVAPAAVASRDGFDANEYARTMGRRIHPFFYSFAGHAVTYAATTPIDRDTPNHLDKSNALPTVTLTLCALSNANIKCLAKNDTSKTHELGTVSCGRLDFSSFDFSCLSLQDSERVRTSLARRERPWVEKQITLTSSGACVPFGIYSVAYHYKNKGKAQNK